MSEVLTLRRQMHSMASALNQHSDVLSVLTNILVRSGSVDEEKLTETLNELYAVQALENFCSNVYDAAHAEYPEGAKVFGGV